MANSAETIGNEPALKTAPPAVFTSVDNSSIISTDDVEFLDQSWAEEFDRRLAAWEAESPSTAPVHDALVPRM
jgi:hypothetical protein